MKRLIPAGLILASLAIPIAFAQPTTQAAPTGPADPSKQALAATVQDLTQVWVATRAQLAAAEAQIATLEAENKALKAGGSKPPEPTKP
jgi:hypothetical protein